MRNLLIYYLPIFFSLQCLACLTCCIIAPTPEERIESARRKSEGKLSSARYKTLTLANDTSLVDRKKAFGGACRKADNEVPDKQE